MDDVESIVKKAINSINTSCILENNFGSLCDTANEKHDVLLNYNHIRCLSFDLSVQRLCELCDLVTTTLVPKFNDLVKQLQQNSFRGFTLFLKDFLPNLSSINLQLQESNLTIINTALIYIYKSECVSVCMYLNNNIYTVYVFQEKTIYIVAQQCV
jgi:hypothetical protein